MIKAVLARLSYWRSALHARMALVLILALIISGLQSHVTSKHHVAPDAQATELLDGHGHSHGELESETLQTGHDYAQDPVDHSHPFSLLANHVEVFAPILADVFHATPQQSITGIDVSDIDKPPKRAAII
jgi:hypothetical protein